MINTRKKSLFIATVMLLISALLLSTASFAWFSMNTTVKATGIEFEAYTDALYLEISQNRENDDDYDVSTAITTSKKAIRPITHRVLESGALVIEPKLVKEDANKKDSVYSPETAKIPYYKKVSAADTNDSFAGDNYLLLNFDDTNLENTLFGELKFGTNVKKYYSFNDGSINFIIDKTNRKYSDVIPDDGSEAPVYYEKEGNSYIVKTMKNDTPLYGLYTVELKKQAGYVEGEASLSDVYYTSGVYYDVTDEGIYPVGGLVPGTSLNDYYVIEEKETHTTSADGQLYHYKNENDYISLGVIDEDPDSSVDLTNYMYWVRSYSDKVGQNAGTGAKYTVDVIDTSKYENEDTVADPKPENPYYLYDELYIRMAEDTNPGNNLRVSKVTVNGVDSVLNSVRILFVATNAKGETARADYDHSNKTITHWDADGILFDTILGSKEEIITVAVYIYFDGEDSSVKTTEGQYMTGQSVSIEFSIDKPDYIKN